MTHTPACASDDVALDAPSDAGAPAPRITHAGSRAHPLRRLVHRFHALSDARSWEAPFGLVVRWRQHPSAPQGGQPGVAPGAEPLGQAQAVTQARRLQATAQALAASVVPTPSGRGLPAPGAQALASDPAAHAAIASLFGDTPDARRLAQALMQAADRPACADAAARRGSALQAAAALRRAEPEASAALAAWSAVAEADAHDGAGAAHAWRAFAASPAAWSTLQAVRAAAGHEAPDAALQVLWQASAELLAHGMAAEEDTPAGWRDFAARQRLRAHTRLGGGEAPHVLACRALSAAGRRLDDPAAALDAKETAAWAAWSCGFRTSGPGSTFNAVVARLHKFTTWARRAEQRPELFSKDFLRALGLGLSTAFASRKLSPLSAMKWGLQGAALGTLAQEQASHDAARGAALGALRVALQALPDDAAARRDLARLDTLDLDTLSRLAARHLEGDAQADCAAALARARGHAQAAAPRPGGALTIEVQRRLAREALEARHTLFAHHGQQGVALGGGVLLDTVLGSLGIWGGPQLSTTHTRRALVRVGSYSMGCELFMGVDTKRHGSLGFAVHAGASIGPMLQGALSGGVGASAAVSPHESTHLEGAVLRVPKTAPDAKRQMAAVQDALFDLAARRRDGEAMDAGALWEALAPTLLAHPDVSVGHLQGAESSWRVGAGLSLGLRGGAGAGGAGPVVGGGLEHQRHRSWRSDDAGALPVSLAQRGRRTTAAFTAGLSGTGLLAFGDGGPLHALRFAAALGGAGVTLHLGGTQCQVRMQRPAGRLQPQLVQAQHDFVRAGDLTAWLRREKAAWAPAFGGEAAFEAVLQRIAALPPGPAGGSRTWSARLHLREDAARTLDHLLGLVDTLAGAPGIDARGLEAQVRALLADPARWQPAQVGVAEPTAMVDDRGWALLFVARERTHAGSEKRYLLLEPAQGEAR